MNQISRLAQRLRPRQGFVAAATLGFALLLAASPVAADSTTGTPGQFKVTDTKASPGTTCNYTPGYPTHYLTSFSVRAPSAKWPSSSASASGKVGWWAVLQRYGGAGWSTLKNGTHHVATATKTTAASFSKATVTHSTSSDDYYRIVVHLAWYGANNAVIGTASHTVSHYRTAYPGWSEDASGSCIGHVTILT